MKNIPQGASRVMIAAAAWPAPQPAGRARQVLAARR